MSGLVDKDGAPVGEDEIKKKDAEIAELKAQIAQLEAKNVELNGRLERATYLISDEWVSTYEITGGRDDEYINVDDVDEYLEENFPDIDVKLWKLCGFEVGAGACNYRLKTEEELKRDKEEEEEEKKDDDDDEDEDEDEDEEG